ncbi:hypothetical protein HYW21_05945 [Candidatus Woesearchaeota archaeon]|nr:hypothetical protein [Candidatus Woesearchaeota archaeon]
MVIPIEDLTKKESFPENRVIQPLQPDLHHQEPLDPRHFFRLPDGSVLRTLHDLREKLPRMDEATFRWHVNEHKNDFASWIQDIFKHEDLAQAISHCQTKEAMITVLEAHATQQHRDLLVQPSIHQLQQHMPPPPPAPPPIPSLTPLPQADEHDEVTELFTQEQSNIDTPSTDFLKLRLAQYQERKEVQQRQGEQHATPKHVPSFLEPPAPRKKAMTYHITFVRDLKRELRIKEMILALFVYLLTLFLMLVTKGKITEGLLLSYGWYLFAVFTTIILVILATINWAIYFGVHKAYTTEHESLFAMSHTGLTVALFSDVLILVPVTLFTILGPITATTFQSSVIIMLIMIVVVSFVLMVIITDSTFNRLKKRLTLREELENRKNILVG